jgi:hypothetical protein
VVPNIVATVRDYIVRVWIRVIGWTIVFVVESSHNELHVAGKG